MKIHNSDDLVNKYNFALIRIFLTYSANAMLLIFTILNLIVGYTIPAFLILSAGIILISESIVKLYDYFLAAAEYTYNVKYRRAHPYISVFILCIDGLLYVPTLIYFRMGFDSSINNTEEEVFLTIGICLCTYIVYNSLSKVNEVMEKYIKIIKS